MHQHRKSRTAIKVANVQEMVTARETLRALGFTIYSAFNTATTLSQYDSVHIDEYTNGANDVARGLSNGFTVDKTYDSLQSFLNVHFKVADPKTPAQVELEKLKESAVALNKQIAALEATI